MVLPWAELNTDVYWASFKVPWTAEFAEL